jgi:DNA-binding XRE family transcriptional regulator
MSRKAAAMTDGVEVLFHRYYQGRPAQVKQLEDERANEEIARRIRELRTSARLTQAELAKIVGTTASVICRLEDADYEGHSLAMLRRIAAALNQRVEIRFIPLQQSA